MYVYIAMGICGSCSPGTWEAEAGRPPVQKAWPHSEFKGGLNSKPVGACLKKKPKPKMLKIKVNLSHLNVTNCETCGMFLLNLWNLSIFIISFYSCTWDTL
jgi:hypothetical protein